MRAEGKDDQEAVSGAKECRAMGTGRVSRRMTKDPCDEDDDRWRVKVG